MCTTFGVLLPRSQFNRTADELWESRAEKKKHYSTYTCYLCYVVFVAVHLQTVSCTYKGCGAPAWAAPRPRPAGGQRRAAAAAYPAAAARSRAAAVRRGCGALYAAPSAY